MRKVKRGILAFACRGGKTATALLAARDDDLIVVVCPLTVVPAWQSEIAYWRPGWTSQVLRHTTTDPREDVNVYIIPDSMVAKIVKLNILNHDYAIIDEGHRFKTTGWRMKKPAGSGQHRKVRVPKSMRTDAVCKLIRQCDRCAVLSATIIPNRHAEAWVWCRELLGMKNKREFERTYCGGWESPWGWDATKSTSKEDFAKLLKPVMVTITAEDLKDTLAEVLPPQLVLLNMPVDHREGSFNMGRIVKNPTSIAFEALSDIMKLSGLRKVGPALAHIELVLEEENKVIVWGWHKEVLEDLKAGRAIYNPAMIHGGIKDTAREEERIRFQTDPECRVMVGQIQAAGVGITLNAAAFNIFVECNWVPGDIHQAISRAGGPDQKRAVRTDILAINQSIDANVLEAILMKGITLTNLDEGTKMTQKQLNKTDHALRALIEARAEAHKQTQLAWLKRVFPKAFVADIAGKVSEDKPAPAKPAKAKPAKPAKPAKVEAAVVEPDPEPVEENDDVNVDALRAVMVQAMKTCGADAVKKVLNDLGAARLSELGPDQYANAAEIMDELIADKTNG